MNSTIIVAIVFFVGGFIFLHTYFFRYKQTREQFLEEMQKILGGKLEPLEDVPNSYKIDFTYEGVKYTFEDLEVEGFSSKYFKAHLKAYTDTKYYFNLRQKSLQKNMRGDSFLLRFSETEAPPPPRKSINLPSAFDRFEAETNHREMSEELLKDSKYVGILKKYKNVDSRGNQTVSVRINDGIVLLEFHPNEYYNPSIHSLRRQAYLIENYVEDLRHLVKMVSYYGERFNLT